MRNNRLEEPYNGDGLGWMFKKRSVVEESPQIPVTLLSEETQRLRSSGDQTTRATSRQMEFHNLPWRPQSVASKHRASVREPGHFPTVGIAGSVPSDRFGLSVYCLLPSLSWGMMETSVLLSP